MVLTSSILEAVEHKAHCEEAYRLVWHSGVVNGDAGGEVWESIVVATDEVESMMCLVAKIVKEQNNG